MTSADEWKQVRYVYVLENECAIPDKYFNKRHLAYDEMEPNDRLIEYREVLDSDLTPDQVIEKVCTFIKGNWFCDEADQVQNLIKANKDRILYE